MPNQPVNQYRRDYIKLYPNGNYSPTGLYGTNTAKFFDIKNLVTDITITESLHQSSLMCTMNVLDGLNMLEDLQLEGNEFIEMQLSKKVPEGKFREAGRVKYKHTFVISDIVNYVRPKPGVQTYQLICISEHAYMNQLMRLNRKFEGNIGKLIQDIVFSDLEQHNNIGKISRSAQSIKGIYPSLRPIDAIRWLTRNAIDDGHPFYFYETLKHRNNNTLNGKIFFKSLKEMADEEIAADYEHKPFYNDINTAEEQDIKEQRKKILSISTPIESSMFGQLKKGAFGSTLSSIDIATKTVKTDEKYKYDDQFVLGDNRFRPFKKEKKFLEKAINEFPFAKSYYASLNTLAFDGFKNYHDATSENIQNASSKMACMEVSQININVCGDPRVSAGSKVRLKIPKSKDADLKGLSRGFVDDNKSGVYIVYDITHTFNFDQEYNMTLLCKKDTSRLDYDKEVGA